MKSNPIQIFPTIKATLNSKRHSALQGYFELTLFSEVERNKLLSFAMIMIRKVSAWKQNFLYSELLIIDSENGILVMKQIFDFH